ncbi:MAG: hypothetical protein U9O86_02365 [Campylobacterota bacterium]|nr:hypothetical protein [Campylobacterota bacterium]
MREDLALALNIANMQENFIIVFKEDEIILTNNSFNTFFGVSSVDEYLSNFGDFINNFVPHPSYFNAEKITSGETWFESIQKLEELDRVVSMLSQDHEPHAFSVEINSEVSDLKIVTFTDITQSLIKRIMVQNNANIDAKSGAYAKQYFLQVMKSYDDAAVFNEKIIALIMIDIFKEDELHNDDVKEFVRSFNLTIRQDDMLIQWEKEKFLLIFLVDDTQKATQVQSKLEQSLSSYPLSGFSYELSSIFQKNNESIAKLIRSID